MTPSPHVSVVIPCHRVADRILGVLAAIPAEVARIYVVDDACPEATAERVRAGCSDPRVEIARHAHNQGVGAATMTGYRLAIAAGTEVIVKLDGDGQMDPALIGKLVAPIATGEADYAKGNRFRDLDGLRAMPRVRLVGNVLLSFLSKLSSGYWNLFDPTNGFTAVHAKVAAALPFERLSRRYFFESDMLFRLYLMGAKAIDVPMRARYGDEVSGLNPWRAIPEFALKHLRNLLARLMLTYYVRDFGVASIELLLAIALLAFGVPFGIDRWLTSEASGVPATAGTVLLAALPVILGTQFLVAFLDFDTRNMPAAALHPRL